jgi:DNA-binding transcriptional regulator PaaX
MKENRAIKKSETMKDVLKVLGAGLLIPAVFLFPGSHLLLREFLKKRSVNKDYIKFRRMLRIAKNKKLIEIIEKGEETFLQITKSGRKELIRYNVDELDVVKPKKWDEIWRVVIFDIPEKNRNARVVLSKKLKEIGFYQFQKSVFILPFKCKNEIDFLIEYFNIKKCVVLFEVKSFGEMHDLILKRHFDLL